MLRLLGKSNQDLCGTDDVFKCECDGRRPFHMFLEQVGIGLLTGQLQESIFYNFEFGLNLP